MRRAAWRFTVQRRKNTDVSPCGPICESWLRGQLGEPLAVGSERLRFGSQGGDSFRHRYAAQPAIWCHNRSALTRLMDNGCRHVSRCQNRVSRCQLPIQADNGPGSPSCPSSLRSCHPASRKAAIRDGSRHPRHLSRTARLPAQPCGLSGSHGFTGLCVPDRRFRGVRDDKGAVSNPAPSSAPAPRSCSRPRCRSPRPGRSGRRRPC